MKVVLLTLCLFCLWTPCALAEDAGSVIRDFGLLGTWSADCSTLGITDAMILVRFTVTSLGEPRMIVGHPDDALYASTIEAADAVGGDGVMLSLDGGLDGVPQQVILRLDDDALQVWQVLDGPGQMPLVGGGMNAATHAKLPELHRCVSE